jgi:putative glutamine amidotransferase
MSARPVLGVSCCTKWVGEEAAQAVIDRYVVAAMEFANVAALLIPARPDLMSAAEVVGRLDGLMLTGSPTNVEPARYGEGGASDAAGPYDAGRDDMTSDLVHAMLALGRPVFGMCRGIQEVNVAFGGSLRRDAARSADILAHHAPPGSSLEETFAWSHEVALAPRGILTRAFGESRITVNSVHYQALGRLGDGLKAEATAPDGLVEAVSGEVNGAQILAVQWHPEWRTAEDVHSRAFFALIGRALRGEAI